MCGDRIASLPAGLMTHISYGLSSTAWDGVVSRIESLIRERGCRRVVEIGGGANPTLSAAFIKESGVEYTLLDISADELGKAPDTYHKVCADICGDVSLLGPGYDLAFSRMLAEHVADGERFHRNIHTLVRPGGLAFHFFPTLYAPPFVVNSLLPERLASQLLHLLQPGRERSGKTGKFPARYQWCRGPSRRQIKRFESAGYEVLQYDGFFGHEPYYQKIPLLLRLHRWICAQLCRYPVAAMTSFAQVTLKRHEAGTA